MTLCGYDMGGTLEQRVEVLTDLFVAHLGGDIVGSAG